MGSIRENLNNRNKFILNFWGTNNIFVDYLPLHGVLKLKVAFEDNVEFSKTASSTNKQEKLWNLKMQKILSTKTRMKKQFFYDAKNPFLIS